MPRPVHFELEAEDPERAVRFYTDVFGWKFDKWEQEGFPYWLITTGGPEEPGIDGGLGPRQPGQIPADRHRRRLQRLGQVPHADLARMAQALHNALLPGIHDFASQAACIRATTHARIVSHAVSGSLTSATGGQSVL